mgnify:CR=1 FL=1
MFYPDWRYKICFHKLDRKWFYGVSRRVIYYYCKLYNSTSILVFGDFYGFCVSADKTLFIKNMIFTENLDFWRKFGFLAKIWVFDENFNFWRNYWRKFQFFTKIWIFQGKIQNTVFNIRILPKMVDNNVLRRFVSLNTLFSANMEIYQKFQNIIMMFSENVSLTTVLNLIVKIFVNLFSKILQKKTVATNKQF